MITGTKMKKIMTFACGALLCLSLLSILPGSSWAYKEIEKHAIDIELEKRMDADPSTYGMIEACEWALNEWDKLLNKNYQALMKKLNSEDQARLRASQREWIKYRDLEFEFNAHYWGGFEGTMYRIFPISFQSDFVRERALRLGYYLEDLNER